MTPEISTTTDALARLKRAVIYLRVSTAGQVKTDRDAEGFSIPAQREGCLRKAESLGAMVLDEYVDAGESARTADRAQLAAMLERLAAQRDIDYVIVHKIDRLARNRVDDVAITWRSAKPVRRLSACPRTSTRRLAECCCTAS
jgi:site-specific DNA recombinase